MTRSRSSTRWMGWSRMRPSDRLQAAMASLSPTQREVFTLRVGEGMSYKEIADAAARRKARRGCTITTRCAPSRSFSMNDCPNAECATCCPTCCTIGSTARRRESRRTSRCDGLSRRARAASRPPRGDAPRTRAGRGGDRRGHPGVSRARAALVGGGVARGGHRGHCRRRNVHRSARGRRPRTRRCRSLPQHPWLHQPRRLRLPGRGGRAPSVSTDSRRRLVGGLGGCGHGGNWRWRVGRSVS